MIYLITPTHKIELVSLKLTNEPKPVNLRLSKVDDNNELISATFHVKLFNNSQADSRTGTPFYEEDIEINTIDNPKDLNYLLDKCLETTSTNGGYHIEFSETKAYITQKS